MKISTGCTVKTQLAQERALARNVSDSGLENVRTLGKSVNSTRNGNSELGSRMQESVVFSQGRKTESAEKESLSEGPDTSSSGGEIRANLGTPKNGASESATLLRETLEKYRDRAEATSKDEEKAAQDPFLEPLVEQQRLSVLQQAQMAAEAVKTGEAIRKIYDEMWAEISKSRADRMALLLKTADEISTVMRECHASRMKASEAHNKAFLEILTGCSKS